VKGAIFRSMQSRDDEARTLLSEKSSICEQQGAAFVAHARQNDLAR